jgi:hypothetical protein
VNAPPAFPTDIEHEAVGPNSFPSIIALPVEIEHPVSAILNPEPEIVTVPAVAMVGDNEM